MTQDKEDIPSNPSNNRRFEDVLNTALSRRTIIAGSLSAAAAGFLALTGCVDDQAIYKDKTQKKKNQTCNKKIVGFEPVPNGIGKMNKRIPTISADYEYQVLVPWGTPIMPGTSKEYTGDPNTRPSPQEASRQIGIGHDGMWFFPKDIQFKKFTKQAYELSNYQGMLAVNHEFGINSHVLGKSEPESLEDVRLSQNVHGVSIVALAKKGKQWYVVKNPNSRRITANTPVAFSGPAAQSRLLQNPAGNRPLGTINNCGSGPTPWGTYLTCEENFNGYFGATEGASFNNRRTEEQLRYGFYFDGFNYGWEKFDARFDLSNKDYINEQNRFGWIVEIDPFDASQKPVKRTALGRFKHEAIAIAESQGGRIAAYMGDDQGFDYIYKYVSKASWRAALKKGESPLDEGRLYAARFDDDGKGQWLELTIDNPVLAARFSSQAEVLIYARIAADLLGATPMDRPEWTTIGTGGYVYCTLTNNAQRTKADAANPEAPNLNGHIIRWKDSGDYLGLDFEWDIFILASATQDTEHTFGSPDMAWADDCGRLFIGTDGGQQWNIQNQLIVFNTLTGESRRLLTGVNNNEITGFTITPDQRTAFINLQHPGNGDPSRTNFPAVQDGITIPRDCTLVITRKDGGIIGS